MPQPPGRAQWPAAPPASRFALPPEARRVSRRTALRAVAALAGGLSLAGCRIGPPPPGPVTLEVVSEPLPQSPLANAFDVGHPYVRLAFARPAAASAVGLRDADLGPAVLGGLLPLGGFLDISGFSPVDVDPATWAAFGGRTGQVGMPMVRSRLVVLFDGAVFAAARVPLPRPGWTLASFLTTAARLAAARPGAPVLAPLPAAVVQGLWATLIAGFGAPLVDASGRFLPSASHRAVEALRAYARVTGLASAAPWGRAGVPLARRPALALRHFVPQDEIDAWIDAGLDVGVAGFPVLPARAVVPAAAWAHGIPRSAPERGAALQFLVWTAGFDGQRFVRGLGLIPVLRSMAGQAPPLVAPGGVDPGALLPSVREDLYPPPGLRRVPAAAAAFATTVGRLRGPGVTAASAASAYAAGAAAANRALRAAGYRGGGPWPPPLPSTRG